MPSRRAFIARLAAGAATLAPAGVLASQELRTGMPGATMSGEGYLPVKRPAKPGAVPSMTPDERDALERTISCPCPCTLDIFACRTSMPCDFAPAIHRDVMALVEGGYEAREIVDALVGTYGESILLLPRKQGFNWVAYLTPFAAIGGGAVLILVLLRRWRRQEIAADAPVDAVQATPDELARLDAAVRRDGR
jgi:cytochrome c-type biogenesis protein CcmH